MRRADPGWIAPSCDGPGRPPGRFHACSFCPLCSLQRAPRKEGGKIKRALLLLALVGGLPAPTGTEAQGVLAHLLCFKAKAPLPIAATADLLTEAQPDFAQRG